MKRLFLLILVFCFSGCAYWDELSEGERKAWIYSGAALGVGLIIADAMDSDTVIVRQCFPVESLETDCIGKF